MGGALRHGDTRGDAADATLKPAPTPQPRGIPLLSLLSRSRDRDPVPGRKQGSPQQKEKKRPCLFFRGSFDHAWNVQRDPSRIMWTIERFFPSSTPSVTSHDSLKSAQKQISTEEKPLKSAQNQISTEEKPQTSRSFFFSFKGKTCHRN